MSTLVQALTLRSRVIPALHTTPSWHGRETVPQLSHYCLVSFLRSASHTKSLTMLLEYFVNVQDTARLHVAAAILPQVKDERIFAYAGRFNWDTVLDILRKHNPGREFIPNFHGGVDANVIKPAARAEDLLRQIGRTGWTSLEESILANTEDLRD